MQKAAMITGLIGAILSLALGVYTFKETLKDKETLEMYNQAAGEEIALPEKEASELRSRVHLTWSLFILGCIALCTAIMIGKIGKLAAPVFLAAALIPMFFKTIIILGTLPLIFAGIFAMFIKKEA